MEATRDEGCVCGLWDVSGRDPEAAEWRRSHENLCLGTEGGELLKGVWWSTALEATEERVLAALGVTHSSPSALLSASPTFPSVPISCLFQPRSCHCLWYT